MYDHKGHLLDILEFVDTSYNSYIKNLHEFIESYELLFIRTSTNISSSPSIEDEYKERCKHYLEEYFLELYSSYIQFIHELFQSKYYGQDDDTQLYVRAIDRFLRRSSNDIYKYLFTQHALEKLRLMLDQFLTFAIECRLKFYHSYIDRLTWHRLIRSDLLHNEYRELFQELHEDEATTAFLDQSQMKSDNIPVQILRSLASTLLTVFIARTSANGLIGRGRMFVYSTAQFKTLLDRDPKEQSQLTSLLDIGAGDGSVTLRMADLFEKVYATEMSSIMQWRLSNYSYTILDADQWGDLKFDVITCLNVLDRCEKPLSLLKNIREHLNSDHGRVIISLVLPFKPYFEYNNDHHPDESIHIQAHLPEEQINEFIMNVFQPLGFRLKKLSRVPYLCEGDMERSYYFLSDYIFALEIY